MNRGKHDKKIKSKTSLVCIGRNRRRTSGAIARNVAWCLRRRHQEGFAITTTAGRPSSYLPVLDTVLGDAVSHEENAVVKVGATVGG